MKNIKMSIMNIFEIPEEEEGIDHKKYLKTCCAIISPN